MSSNASPHIVLPDYNTEDSLIYGIGNIGRQDDGLGWAFIDWLERQSVFPRAELMRHYQLHLEDADLISRKKQVLFVDATQSTDVQSFQFEAVTPKMDFSFTSHAISAPAILATCKTCFDYMPKVHFLSIRGYAWALSQGMTTRAWHNLYAASEFIWQQKNQQTSTLCGESHEQTRYRQR